jgi:hypothetical protein
MPLNWIEQEDNLGADMLTVRAQAQDVDDMDTLLHPALFPYQDTDSVELKNLVELDERLVAERREWNARGRRMHISTPDLEEIEMIPLEVNFKVGEKEQQALRERTLQNEDLFRQQLRVSIPERVDRMPPAIFRRVEIEAMEALATGEITVRLPDKEDGSGNLVTSTVPLSFASERIQTASTAWDDGSVNAYEENLSWLEDAETMVGAIQGQILRRSTLRAIQEDAPHPMPGAQSGLRPTVSEVEEVLADELGLGDYTFYTVENTFDPYTGAGNATASQKVWPDGYTSVVPQGGIVGATYRAPVLRAMELAGQFPNAGIDTRGTTVYYDYENGGRTAAVECQANHMALPAEQRVFSIDTQVTTS